MFEKSHFISKTVKYLQAECKIFQEQLPITNPVADTKSTQKIEDIKHVTNGIFQITSIFFLAKDNSIFLVLCSVDSRINMNLEEISQSTINSISNFPHHFTGKIVKVAIAALRPNTQDLKTGLNNLAEEENIPIHELYDILNVYMTIIKLFVKSSEKDFIGAMTEVGFSNIFLETLPFLNNGKEYVETVSAPNYNWFQNVSSIKWRIDISLLNSSLVTKTLPNILLSIGLKDKDKKCYAIEVNPRAFNLLRFNIALILKEMKNLKSNASLTKMI